MLDNRSLARLCQSIRLVAREELLGRFNRVASTTKADGSVLTEADLSMQRRLAAVLAGEWPQVDLLGEEMSEADQALLLADGQGPLWCLDPLDGTGNYASGIPFFAVSLALILGGQVEAGVVYDPVRDECFSALRGQGAWCNDRPMAAPQAAPIRLDQAMAMVDLKRLPAALVMALAGHAPYRSQRSFGSVALDWCWVASGRCQVYLHGGQRLWDYAAGRLILQESGGVGGLLDEFTGDWSESLSLTSKIALAATQPALLQAWRDWLVVRV